MTCIGTAIGNWLLSLATTEKHCTEITLHETADSYLKGVLNGKTRIPLKLWKAERAKLTVERSRLD